MNIKTALKLKRKPMLPGDGDRRLDEAYESWAKRFVEEQNGYWADACDSLGFPNDTPLFDRWELDVWLYRRLGIGRVHDASEFSLNYHHDKHWLAVRLNEEREEVVQAAREFVAMRRGREPEGFVQP